MKKVLVTGSSGYVANFIMKQLARQYPNLAVVGMSRSAKARDDEIKQLQNVSFVRGDCLEPRTFTKHIDDADSVIHCVGTLFQKKNSSVSSYRAMNTETCVNMAKALNDIASSQSKKKTFVMISSEKAPPFLEEYVTSKREAENYLLNECNSLTPTIIRPGFIYDKNHRWWSMYLKKAVDCEWWLNERFVKKLPFSENVDFLFPAKSTQLSTVSHFAIEGAQGKLEEKIITNDMMIEFEKHHNLNME